MTHSQAASTDLGRAPSALRSSASPTAICALASALVLAIAFFVQKTLMLNADSGWLFTVDEFILSGRKLDVDIFELNPPMSPYMYMPAVIVAKAIGARPEVVATVLILIGICMASAMFWKVSAAFYRTSNERLVASTLLLAVLALLPGDVFGQREHIAVVALTPFIALAAARDGGYRPSLRLALAAGLGAGFAMSIKPHFAIVAGLPLLLRCLQNRSLRPLWSVEFWSSSVAVIAYWSAVVLLFPEFVRTYAPMLRDIYPQMQAPLSVLLFWRTQFTIAVLAAALAYLFIVNRPRLRPALFWLAAALGGLATYLIQGTSWSYTGAAMITYAVVAMVTSEALVGPERPPRARLANAAVALVAAYCGLRWFAVPPQFEMLEKPVARLSPHPKVIALSDDIAIGHPLVRNIGGRWVGSSCSLFLAGGAISREQHQSLSPEVRQRMERIIALDRGRLLADLRAGRPDVILVDHYLFSRTRFDWGAWAKSDPALARELAAYRPAETVGRISIWLRRPSSPAARPTS